MSSAATAASLARPPRGVQVECNAPVTTFSVERAPTAESGATANVSDVALAAQMAVAERAKQDRTKLAKFRMDTLIRLREKAQAKRDAAAEKEAAEALRTAEATEYEIIQRADPTPPPSATSEEPPSTAPLPPSQLALMRYGLSEQAFAARDLLLSRCELPMPPQPPSAPQHDGSGAGYFDGIIPPSEALKQPAYAGGTTRRFVPSANAKSMRQAVVSTAAHADRQHARDTRKRQQAQMRKALAMAQRAEAVMAEREAAEKQAKLRAERLALEQAAQLREEADALASVTSLEQQRYQKVIESERYFDALREQLREEAARAKRPLPPICSCGLDPLENHTEQCARNCIFFNNPAAYGRALSGLFVRPIVLD